MMTTTDDCRRWTVGPVRIRLGCEGVASARERAGGFWEPRRRLSTLAIAFGFKTKDVVVVNKVSLSTFTFSF
eukprot:1107959-Prorocentrum_minimum.AAC.6